jgi:streptogramin lyase
MRDDQGVSERASATATFLFTDIEGSTALLKQLRERYAEVLADQEPGWMAWADGYGHLWWSSDASTTLSRMSPASGAVTYSHLPGDSNPFIVAVAGDTVWTGDLGSGGPSDNPRVFRVDAVSRAELPPVELPGTLPENGRVFGVAAASAHVWAATPAARSIWKIDAKTNAVERIQLGHSPVGVTASGDDVWVTVGENE